MFASVKVQTIAKHASFLHVRALIAQKRFFACGKRNGNVSGFSHGFIFMRSMLLHRVLLFGTLLHYRRLLSLSRFVVQSLPFWELA